eukprot:scaffold90852_cov63-Phaeocystis_antarctica.AAC.3
MPERGRPKQSTQHTAFENAGKGCVCENKSLPSRIFSPAAGQLYTFIVRLAIFKKYRHKKKPECTLSAPREPSARTHGSLPAPTAHVAALPPPPPHCCSWRAPTHTRSLAHVPPRWGGAPAAEDGGG